MFPANTGMSLQRANDEEVLGIDSSAIATSVNNDDPSLCMGGSIALCAGLTSASRMLVQKCMGATLGKRYLRVYPAAAAVGCFCLGWVNPPPAVAEKKRLSGLDLSQRLRKSRRIHVGRFSGPGDHP